MPTTQTAPTAGDQQRTPFEWSPRRKYSYMRRLVMGGVVLVLGLAAVAAFVPVEDHVNAAGQVYPADDHEIHSPVEGVISQLDVLPGQRVTKGQVVARLDDKSVRDALADLDAQRQALVAGRLVAEMGLAELRLEPLPKELRSTASELARAQASLALARKKLDRARRLAERKAMSTQAVEDLAGRHAAADAEVRIARDKHDLVRKGLAEAIVAKAQAGLKHFDAQLAGLGRRRRLVEEEQRRRVLRSPVAGRVVAVPKREGQAVDPGELVAIVASSDRTEVILRVDEEYSKEVAQALPVRVYSSVYPYRDYGWAEGHVSAVDPWARHDADRPYYRIWVAIESAPFDMKLGSTVTAEIVLGTEPLYRVLFDR